MSNKIYKIFVEKIGGHPADSFIGQLGDIFFDPDSMTLRKSDGITPGGQIYPISDEALLALIETKAPIISPDPNGFLDKSQTNLSWNNNTRTLTISPTGQSFKFYADSIEYTKSTAQSITIPDISSDYFIYFNELGELTYQTSFDISVLGPKCYVAALYYNSDLNKAIPDVIDERHGCSMTSDTHMYLHSSRGTAYHFDGGLKPSVGLIDGTGNLESNIQIAVTSGSIWDEDLHHQITEKLLTDNIPIMHRTGTDTWVTYDSGNVIAYNGGTGLPYYNLNTNGIWSLARITNNNFGLAHLFAIPGLTTKFIIVMGTRTFTSVSQVTKDNVQEDYNNLTGFRLTEFKSIASFVFQSNTNYSNSVHSKIITIDPNFPFYDWRGHR